MKIFVVMKPLYDSDALRKEAREEVKSRYGADWGDYIYTRPSDSIAVSIKKLGTCQCVMFADEAENSEVGKIFKAICDTFSVPIYR